MRKLNILFIPDSLKWKTSTNYSPVVTRLLVVPCTAAPTVGNLNLSLFAATAAFVLPVVISTICSALPLCLLK